MSTEAYPPRRSRPGTRYGWTDAAGRQQELAADDEGVVRPSSAEEVRVLDGYGLPVARKAQAEDKAEAEAKSEAKAKTKEGAE